MLLVMGISLGSNSRNFNQLLQLNGVTLRVIRLGVNGSKQRAIQLLRKVDGKVPYLGLGGVNCYYRWGDKLYGCAEGLKIAGSTVQTVVVDGSGVKRELDWQAFKLLDSLVDLQESRVLVVSALDRPHLVDFFDQKAKSTLIGDAIFGLKLPLPFYSQQTFGWAVTLTMPLLRHLPLKFLYPTGKKQEESINNRLSKYAGQADIICGDFHLFRRFLPLDLTGKTLMTTTVTEQDLNLLNRRGLQTVITCSPFINGRALGANVWEAVLCTLEGKLLAENQVPELLVKYKIKPSVIRLN